MCPSGIAPHDLVHGLDLVRREVATHAVDAVVDDHGPRVIKAGVLGHLDGMDLGEQPAQSRTPRLEAIRVLAYGRDHGLRIDELEDGAEALTRAHGIEGDGAGHAQKERLSRRRGDRPPRWHPDR